MPLIPLISFIFDDDYNPPPPVPVVGRFYKLRRLLGMRTS